MAVQWFRHRETGVEVAALQFGTFETVDSFEEVEEFTGGDAQWRGSAMVVAVAQGSLWVGPRGWIVRDSDGAFSSHPPDALPLATWEPFVSDGPKTPWPQARPR